MRVKCALKRIKEEKGRDWCKYEYKVGKKSGRGEISGQQRRKE